jgi:hypothetical protein
MRPPADDYPPTPEERTRELARILAVGLLRLRDRAAFLEPTPEATPPANLAENSLENRSELP